MKKGGKKSRDTLSLQRAFVTCFFNTSFHFFLATKLYVFILTQPKSVFFKQKVFQSNLAVININGMDSGSAWWESFPKNSSGPVIVIIS